MYDDDASPLMIPPHSIEAERSVLGGLMIAQDAWFEISSVVEAEDFYRNDHRQIFRRMRDLVDHEQPIDAVTVAEALDNINELENVGGISYLSELTASTPTTANIGAYARIVSTKARRRKILSESHELASSMFGDKDADVALHKFLGAVEEADATTEQVSLKTALTKAVEHTDAAYNGAIAGIPTGIERFDERHGGLQDGHLYIIGARPGMGKTAVACNMMLAAINAEKSVGFMSLEMPSVDIAQRMISLAGGVASEKLRNGKMDDMDWPLLTSGVAQLSDKPMEIFEGSDAHISELVQIGLRMKHRNKIDLLVIDYLQLISGDGSNRAEELSQVTRRLKSLAKRLKIPVVALAQINRDVVKRSNKRPNVADLKDSGSIEQDADMVVMLHREGYYDETAEDNTLEFIIGKNRHGPVGTIWCGWIGELMRIKSRGQNEHDA